MKRKLILSTLAVMFLAAVGLAAEKTKSGDKAKLQITQCAMRISGMTCGGCAAAAEATLAKIPGVKSAKVDFNTAEAAVEYDSKLTTAEKIVAAFNESGGFRAQLSDRPSK